MLTCEAPTDADLLVLVCAESVPAAPPPASEFLEFEVQLPAMGPAGATSGQPGHDVLSLSRLPCSHSVSGARVRHAMACHWCAECGEPWESSQKIWRVTRLAGSALEDVTVLRTTSCSEGPPSRPRRETKCLSCSAAGQ